MIDYTPSLNNIRFYSGGAQRLGSTSDNLEDSEWHHIVVTRDGSNDMVLYVDNVPRDNTNFGQDYTSTDIIEINSRADGALSGRSDLDEIGIWKGEDIGSSGVSDLWNGGAGFAYPFTPADTCTYSSGDWEIDCSDNCVISSPVDVGSNDIFIIGTGTFLTSEDIIGYDRLHIEGTDSSNICHVTCAGGCFR